MRAVAGPSEPPTRPRTAGSAAHMRQWRGCAGRGAGAARQCAQRSGWACAGRALMRLSSGMTTPREEKLCARPACGQDTPRVAAARPLALMPNMLRVAAVSCGACSQSSDSAARLTPAAGGRLLRRPPAEQYDRAVAAGRRACWRGSGKEVERAPAAAHAAGSRQGRRGRPPATIGAAPPCAAAPCAAAHVRRPRPADGPRGAPAAGRSCSWPPPAHPRRAPSCPAARPASLRTRAPVTPGAPARA